MSRVGKRVLKFLIETAAIVLIVYGVFTTGGYLKARKDSQNQQESSQQTQNADNSNNNNNQEQSNNKMTQVELDEAMKNIIAQYQGNNEIGVVYKNFSTGYSFSQDADQYFTAASTIKVAYAMKIYDRINAGEISKDDDIAYNPSFLEAGGGLITNQPKQASYKLDYVIQNMIQYSDNTATRMLIGSSATASRTLVSYFSDLGITLPLSEAQQNRVTPEMMGVVWTKLYNERDKYSDLIQYLEASDDSEWIKDGIGGKTIASKYGGIDTYMHDTAIVFGNTDYMLLIYTNNLRNSGQSITNMAREINKLTDENM